MLTTPSIHPSLCLEVQSSVRLFPRNVLAALPGRKAGKTSAAKCTQSQPSPWNLWLGGGHCCYYRALEPWSVWPACTFPSQPNLTGTVSCGSGNRPRRCQLQALWKKSLSASCSSLSQAVLSRLLHFLWPIHFLSSSFTSSALRSSQFPTSSILCLPLGATKQSLKQK